MWKIKDIKEFANKLYLLKKEKPKELKGVELEFYTYADWEADTNMQLQNQVIQESNKKAGVIENTIESWYDNLQNYIE